MKQATISLTPETLFPQAKEAFEAAITSFHFGVKGMYLDAVNTQLQDYLKVNYSLLIQSGAAALHLALQVLDVGEGDVVLCSNFTYIATITPVLYQKAIPVLIDAEPQTGNMDPVLLEQAIKDALAQGVTPKAIVVVHSYGVPANMEVIMLIAKRYNIPVIEDAAEAYGSRYNGESCGTIGDLGILSFNTNKIISADGGGALVSNNKSYIYKAMYLARQANTPQPHYYHEAVGYNYLMHETQAVLLNAQLINQQNILDHRKAQHKRNLHALKDKGISFFEIPEGSQSNDWLTVLFFENKVQRQGVQTILTQAGISSRNTWYPMHLQPVLKKYKVYGGKVSEDMFERGLCIPSGWHLKATDEQLIVNTIIESL